MGGTYLLHGVAVVYRTSAPQNDIGPAERQRPRRRRSHFGLSELFDPLTLLCEAVSLSSALGLGPEILKIPLPVRVSHSANHLAMLDKGGSTIE